MKVLNRLNRGGGFTLVEVIIVIVTLGLLSAIAFPKYQDITNHAKANACRGSLTAMREGINIWRNNKIVTTGATIWPPIDTLRTVNVIMSFKIPPNPFQAPDRAPDSIVTGVTKGVTVGTRGGWAYKASTGELWANTSTSVSTPGCGTPTAVGENTW